MKHGLNVPGIAIKPLIEAMENLLTNTALLRLKEPAGKIIVDFLVKRIQLHQLRTLIKGPLGRTKHLNHQMLLATREHKPHIMHKLNIRAQQGLSPFFRIICYLLKFVDGQIDPLVQIFKMRKNALQRIFRLNRNHADRYRWHSRQ